jgi:LacI family transcriptional regulator
VTPANQPGAVKTRPHPNGQQKSEAPGSAEVAPPARRATPTITDVAALAEVSIATVSKSLNGRPGVRVSTRARVLEAAEALGFQSNELARSLLTGRSYTVGLITNDSYGRFTMPVLLGAEDTLQSGQLAVLLCDGRDDSIREQHYLKTLLARRVDGIIVTGRRSDPRPPISRHHSVPVVYAMSESGDQNDASILPDDEGGGLLAVQHLLATGRARIGHITGPASFRAARLRAVGAERALAEAGLPLAGGEALYGEWSEAWGRQAARILLRSAPSTDAVFCGSDQVARGVADALRESGVRVPDDIALVGFDNWSVMAEAAQPPLTTVDMNLHEVGRTAAEALLSAIAGRPEHGTRSVPSRLVVRAST